MLLFALLIATSAPAAQEPAVPPPDPVQVQRRLALTTAAVCAGSCLANAGGLYLGLTNGLAFAPAGPLFGLVAGAAGGGLAEALTPDREAKDPQILWGTLCAAGGYLLVGGSAAVVGYVLGTSASAGEDAPALVGGFTALGLGALGGAVGAGAGTLFALLNEPPQL